jgi:hypothetical protein
MREGATVQAATKGEDFVASVVVEGAIRCEDGHAAAHMYSVRANADFAKSVGCVYFIPLFYGVSWLLV